MQHAWRRRENHTNFLVGKLEGWKTQCQLEDDFKIDLQEIGLGADWIHLAHDWDMYHALVQTVMKLYILLNEGNFLSS